MQRFPEKLRTLREKHGLTVRELAQQLGFKDHTFVYRLETGERHPNVEHVVKIARLFKVSFDELLDDEVELGGTRQAGTQD